MDKGSRSSVSKWEPRLVSNKCLRANNYIKKITLSRVK